MSAGWLVLVWALIHGVNSEPWNVTAPRRITGVVGSCVSVPCSFDVPEPYTLDKCSGGSGGAVWREGQLGPITEGHVLGDVKRKNCTTVFGNFTKERDGIYFFRLDCPKSQFKYTFKQGVHITVKQGVAPPSLTSVTSLSHVTEGVQVTLQCTVMVPCPFLPPSVTWATPEGNRRERVQILQPSDGQMKFKSTLSFTASPQHHNQTITCSVSYPLSTGGSTEASINSPTLNVLYGPSSTAAEVSVSGPVSEGDVVVFTCSSTANPPVSAYAWFSNTDGTMVQVGEGRTLPLQVTQAHSGLYECQARSERGAQRSKPVVLEVTAQRGPSPCAGFWLFVVCGVLSALYVLTVALLFHKYRSLSKKLKEMAQKGDNIYSELQINSNSSVYDKLQVCRPNVDPPEVLNYENIEALGEVFEQKPGRASE